MPKYLRYQLRWVEQAHAYQLFIDGVPSRQAFGPDWLERISSFSFRHRDGTSYTVRKQTVQRGGAYWYGYRRLHGSLLKRYLGTTHDLSIPRLEEGARLLLTGEPSSPQSSSRSSVASFPSDSLQQPPETLLLISKLSPPPPLSVPLIERTALLARLDTGLLVPLILLQAPAGFGKTTLVTQWITERRIHPHFPVVAWLSLDAGDNDPIRFWRSLIRACQTLCPSAGQSALTQLSQAVLFRRPPLETTITHLLNELAQSLPKGLLVLDDYHAITEPCVHETLAFFLDHIPTMLQVVLLSRAEPSLPLPRWRARGVLFEVHATDLRFSLQEMGVFWDRTLSMQLEDSVLALLDTYLEGWPAGLRLLTLTLRERSRLEIEQVLASLINASHSKRGAMSSSFSIQPLIKYFITEILQAQPESLQQFLLETSVLSRMTVSLCNAITMRNDSEHLLAEGERMGLFVPLVDGTECWYRSHRLFAEALQAEASLRLGKDRLRLYLSRACSWYEQRGMLTMAVEIALQAEEWSRAAMLIETFLERQHLTEALHSEVLLLRWLEDLPESVRAMYPSLCLAYAMALLFTLDRSDPATKVRISGPLQQAERSFQTERNGAKLGEALAFRSLVAWWQGDHPQAFLTSRQALTFLPEQESLWRHSCFLTMGREHLLEGEPGKARKMALKAQIFFEVTQNAHGLRAATLLLCDIHMQQGELHQAAQLHHFLLTQARTDPLEQGQALLGLAQLSYEWNELTTAEQQVREALDRGRHHMEEIGGYHVEQFLLIPGSLVLAQVLQASGKTQQAQQVLHELVVLASEWRWPYLHREVLACQAQLGMAAHDLAVVEQWMALSARPDEIVPVVQQEREALIIARWQLVQGEVQACLKLLERWYRVAHVQRRQRMLLQIQVLMALALAAHDSMPQAKQLLIESLRFARAQGYQRLFLDEGEALTILLRTVLRDLREEPLVAYVRQLLLSNPSPQAEHQLSPQMAVLLTEPLSPQEHRVLLLLTAGCSNKEIAQTLVVSINTVKTQVRSIYRKLGVKSRWEVHEAAHRLGLLDSMHS